MDKQIHIIVKGKVQGVYFRDYTQRQALKLGLKGTVRNKSDGSVEIQGQGDLSQLQKLEEWCWEGPPYSSVVAVNVKEISNLTDYSGFKILF